MWDGRGRGPWGRPPFRGDHHRGMFGGRDHPMPGFRGRDGMNMGPLGPMGHMGPGHQDFHPMDRRRMDGPPMRGRDMDSRDLRGREPNRDFFRPGEEPDFSQRRQFEVCIGERMMDSSAFPGPGRDLEGMGGRDMPPWHPNDRFFDMRDRESFHHDMPRFNRPNFDERKGFPMNRMEPNDGFRDIHDRHPLDAECYDMNRPPHERRMTDIDGRGGPPLIPRGQFDSDMDFRSQPGPPPVELKDRDRSPLRYGRSDVPSVDRERLDMPSEVGGPQSSEFMGSGDSANKDEYPDSSGSPVMDYRCGEEMTLAEEWKNRQKESYKRMGSETESKFPVGFSDGSNKSNPPTFSDIDKPSFPGKDDSFTHSDRFLAMGIPPVGNKGPQDLLPKVSPLTDSLDRESKPWLEDRDPKFVPNRPNCDERFSYHQRQNEPPLGVQDPDNPFQNMKDVQLDQVPSREDLGDGHNFQRSSTLQAKDQDYRDIDYRTESGRIFEYKQKDLQPPETLLKDSKPITPPKFADSGSQDQDYRNSSLKNKASNTISVSGIPKTTMLEQILSSFAVRDGVPMQGMKVQNFPGYSYDMAYVEFLDLDDAVHFMESNKGSLKLGTRTASMKYVQPDECKRDVHQESDHKVPEPLDSQLPRSDEPFEELNGSTHRHPAEQQSHTPWQRSSDLTPEAWQQQVDQQLQEQEELEQQAESLNSHDPHHRLKSVFSESKTMIIKNVKVTTTVETILKALDPFAYLDERNVRLVKGKPHAGKYGKSFCFVDMDSHEQVTRLVELLTKPKPLYIDGVRVHAEVARPLKNPNIRRDFDKQGALPPGIPSEAGMIVMQLYPQPLHYLPPPLPHAGAPPGAVGAMPGDLVTGCLPPALPSDPSLSQGVDFGKTAAVAPVYSTEGLHVSPDAAGTTTTSTDGSQLYVCGSEVPDTSNYLFDSTSGFFYDPETTLYYDPNSRYFYNAQTQEYLYWDATLKTYIPVPGGHSAETRPATTMTAEDQAILSNPAADAPLEMKKPSEPPQASTAAAPVSVSAENSTEAGLASTAAPDKKEDDESPKKDKEDKPRSIAAVKIMKDMERWAKIQNRQKDSVRAPSPVLRTEMEGEKKQSKSADAAFAIFERKISGGDELFKTPLTPAKKEEKSKRPMGSLGLLASDYGAGSDEEVEEDREEAAKTSQKSQPEEKGDKLTDWKKMACLLCRRQFPNKDALIRHQQLSDLHKQNMEIHLKIKRSKKELEALENQEKKLHSKEPSGSPEKKKRKHYHHHSHKRSNTRAGSSGETNQVSERPGLGAEPVQQKKEPVVWDHTTYKQAVRKAMFARFKELE
ncbi:RNA-binding protein 5 isoform X3 [Nothobranchius furzeri]|uniref:Transcript variant X3 n=1 Tax=Nothobranchius furzeri TaxID=105023 RepID=A0A9D2XTD0_NOTFU|nr:transcript variant X3 [Nothobranchius furzeri]